MTTVPRMEILYVRGMIPKIGCSLYPDILEYLQHKVNFLESPEVGQTNCCTIDLISLSCTDFGINEVQILKVSKFKK